MPKLSIDQLVLTEAVIPDVDAFKRPDLNDFKASFRNAGGVVDDYVMPEPNRSLSGNYRGKFIELEGPALEKKKTGARTTYLFAVSVSDSQGNPVVFRDKAKRINQMNDALYALFEFWATDHLLNEQGQSRRLVGNARRSMLKSISNYLSRFTVAGYGDIAIRDVLTEPDGNLQPNGNGSLQRPGKFIELSSFGSNKSYNWITAGAVLGEFHNRIRPDINYNMLCALR